ncbi:MAG: AI-2E family transporter [Holosporales bacterium]|nr:AI-2E family transporter [Holosporales bacterium]
MFVVQRERNAIAVTLGVIAAVASLIFLIGQWLIPFVIALVIAYALHAPVDWMTRKLRLPRSVATGLATLSLVAAVSTFTVFFAPLLKNAVVTIIQKLPAFLQTFPEKINMILRDFADTCGIEHTFDVAYDFKKYVKLLAAELPSCIFTFIDTGIALAHVVMFVFITPIITFYLLKDWHAIVNATEALLCKIAPSSVFAVIQRVNVNLAAYIKGQLLVCIILSILYSTGLEIIGLHESVVCGILSGICSIAPFFGPLIGLMVSLVMMFDDAPATYQYVNVICLFAIIPFIDSNFVTPKLIGRKTGIHPVWLLFMICAAGSVLGLSGIFIAVPVAVVLSTICKECMRRIRPANSSSSQL